MPGTALQPAFILPNNQKFHPNIAQNTNKSQASPLFFIQEQ